MLVRCMAQKQTFARIIQYRHLLPPAFCQNTMGEPSKAQDVDIHDPVSGMLSDHIHLRLHRKLVRHQNKKIPLRLSLSPFDHFSV